MPDPIKVLVTFAKDENGAYIPSGEGFTNMTFIHPATEKHVSYTQMFEKIDDHDQYITANYGTHNQITFPLPNALIKPQVDKAWPIFALRKAIESGAEIYVNGKHLDATAQQEFLETIADKNNVELPPSDGPNKCHKETFNNAAIPFLIPDSTTTPGPVLVDNTNKAKTPGSNGM